MRRTIYRRCSIVALTAFFLPLTASAQWDEAKNGLAGLYGSIASLLMTVMGIGAGVVLVMIILKIIRGDDKEAVNRLFWWIGGLVFGMIALAVLKTVILTKFNYNVS